MSLEKPSYKSLNSVQKAKKFGNPVPPGFRGETTTFTPPKEFQERIISYKTVLGGKKVFISVNKLVAKQWECFLKECDPYILTYDGSYVPRLVRGTTLGTPSSHAFGTSMDFNAQWNPLGAKFRPGATGSVEKMVEVALKYQMYWGGWFTRVDCMHFESTMTDEELEKTGIDFGKDLLCEKLL